MLYNLVMLLLCNAFLVLCFFLKIYFKYLFMVFEAAREILNQYLTENRIYQNTTIHTQQGLRT